mmetsp:Transcript_2498/g.4538  ORF Transcript_2498/g.4538 Transcript_2498/m.4538 type:complete len:339 (+) Transcript_2498:44-1060(+)|eukprot:CAMPEP_0114437834 /NCGR_PEP_ID=MMETSP0103-20121206/14243_1 /TAXON_ID=37642 ORGANISM="Paraphysomonas imperforata, Strain PA2" /NCGR_SAMPLE_ID=MMETSP0103 /ASSEMBLY_ACC=CAM_ASM_000201 /LENGTH=338 /DNA_ID=CAMNT_0001608289 /DNA_START=40 /DNA_END=1056 /DNA_ORIENTATION=+
MSMRDIPDLSLLCLKVIAKTPTQFINEKSLARPYQAYPRSLLNSCTQMIIDYVSEAGRLTDAVFPLGSFDTDRTHLSLRNSKVSVQYLTAVLKRCPQLTSLDISGCFPIDDDVISDVLDLCPLLENLCIRNCRKLTDTALITLQKKSKHLTVLSIGGNINLTDNGLQRFINQFSGAPRLLELHVSGLPLSPALLAAIAKRCTSLRNISIGYAILTTETFRSFIEQVGPGLDQLSIAWVEGAVTHHAAGPSSSVSLGSGADFLDLVRTCCPLLTVLDLTGVKSVNAAALQQFLDFKYTQMEKFPGEWKFIRHLKIKFVSVTKQQLEHLRATYPDVLFDV